MNARAIASRIGRMTGQALLTISVVVILVFLLVRITPGDPVKVILGTEYSPERAAALAESVAGYAKYYDGNSVNVPASIVTVSARA